ncbi:Profilin [Mycena indigotica]|uniref:Profilin n=1 Tax=Mycena indigotica TaxID=2126181 RepID=A0A8H6SSI3_9AGAR|nr:Profilin [Mycena indigotica]KAF7303881.1 Profilin [Mycena indigotica]
MAQAEKELYLSIIERRDPNPLAIRFTSPFPHIREPLLLLQAASQEQNPLVSTLSDNIVHSPSPFLALSVASDNIPASHEAFHTDTAYPDSRPTIEVYLENQVSSTQSQDSGTSSIASSRHATPQAEAEALSTNVSFHPAENEAEFEHDSQETQGTEDMKISSSPSPIPGLSDYRCRPNDRLHILCGELLDVRREINAKLIKESAIVEALRGHQAEIPGLQQGEISLQDKLFIYHTRAEFLKHERDRLKGTRDQVENAIGDVARNERLPFISPALLDMFVEISKLSTQVVNSQALDATQTS